MTVGKKPRRRLPRYTRLAPTGGPKRRRGVRRVNPQRKASRFAETYHSVGRVAWVKTLPCAACLAFGELAGCAGRIENAHVGGNDGASRKGPYWEIAPLGRAHHRRFDEYKPPFDTEAARAAMLDAAAQTEAAWRAATPARTP